MYRYLLICILSLLAIALSGQIEVAYTSDIIDSESALYDLELSNPSGNPYILYFEIEVRQDNQLVYQSRTNQYSLVSPIAIINQNLLQPIQVLRNDVLSWSNNCQIDIRAIDQSTQQVLYVDRFTMSGDTDSTSEMKNGIDFQYSGEANLYGQAATMQGIGSQIPQNYLRAEIHPDVQVSGIPIGLDILLSTEQNAFRQSINQVALRFDAQQFKRSMQQRLQSKIKEIGVIGDLADVQNLDQLKEKALSKKFPNLQEWESQLNDSAIQNGLGQIKQLESLEQVISAPEVKEAILNKAELEAKERLSEVESTELKRLQSFVAEIEKLQKKAEELKIVAEKYEQYKDLGKKIAQAKKYANKDIIKDPSFLKDGLKSLGLISKPQEILNGFDAITIGTSFPFYSRQTLSSLSINGINVEWNPGKLYLATTYGQSARMTFNSNFIDEPLTLPQTALAIKAGYGSPQSTHLHLTYINITDRFDSEFITNSTTPQDNRIIGASGQLSLFSDKITVGGEVNASLLTRDNTIETDAVQEFRSEDFPLNSLYANVNNSSSFDLAWRAYTDLRVLSNVTKIKASIERVGANYYSLGAPVLLNDILRWKTELRQSFFKNKLSLSAFARQDANNLDPLLTSSATTTQSFGISGSANIPKWPSLTFSFAPYSQNNELLSTNESFNTNATILNASLGYPLQISESLTTYTQLTYMSQNLNSNLGGIDYDLTMYGLSQSITYNRQSLNMVVNYTPNQVINDENNEVLSLNASASSLLFHKLNTSLGLQYLTVSNRESRTGYFINISYPIASFIDLQLRTQRNIYNDNIDGKDFQDVVAWGGLTVRW